MTGRVGIDNITLINSTDSLWLLPSKTYPKVVKEETAVN